MYMYEYKHLYKYSISYPKPLGPDTFRNSEFFQISGW